MSADDFETDRDETEKRIAQREKDAEFDRLRERVDIKDIMAVPAGRRFVWRLLCRAGVYQSSFDRDASMMAFAEGRRSQGLKLLADLMDVCPEMFALMQSESQIPRSYNPNA